LTKKRCISLLFSEVIIGKDLDFFSDLIFDLMWRFDLLVQIWLRG
jgi:hypothetical protein